LTKIGHLFSSGIEDLWNRSGFLHCTNQNYLLALLLVKSRKFTENDIEPKWTLLWGLSPHQYLKVKVGDNYKNIDAWAARYGIGFGRYAHGFHTGKKVK
jgi:hypothetical protein